MPNETQLILFNDAALRKDCELDDDVFALETRLRPVYEAILSSGTTTPFSVMVTGSWGTGKTSAMRWLDRYLQDPSKRGGRAVVDTCWFYPWKYQDRDDVWKGLIAEVILASISFQNVDTGKVLTAARQFGRFLGGGFVRVLSALKPKIEADAPGIARVAAELDMKEALSGIIEEYGKHVTPQSAYYNVFEKMLEEWIGACYSGNKRLVVFIDDLDRCLPAIALQVLEAIKLYLNIGNLIIVVGVDRHVIDAVVTKHYRDCLGDDTDEFRPKARQYLDKMFQVEVPISPRDEQVKTYIEGRIKQTPLWEHISTEYQAVFIGVIDEMAEINPRNVLRALNTAIIGAAGEKDPIRLAQQMQVALITAVLQKLPEDRFGRVYNLCLHAAGRSFFRRWSTIVAQYPEGPHYLRANELMNKADSSSAKSFTQTKEDISEFAPLNPPVDAKGLSIGKTPAVAPADSSQADQDEARDALRRFEWSLSSSPDGEPKYPMLLTVRTLGLLMRIPYEVEGFISRSNLTPIRRLLAERRGVGIDQVTEGDLNILTHLDVSDTPADDTLVDSLKGLRNLETLYLNGTEVTDNGLEYLKGLTNLKTLWLDSTPVTDKGLENLKYLTNLESLSLGDIQVTGNDLEYLKGLTNLKSLWLNSTQVTDLGLGSLKGLTNLGILALDDTEITDSGLMRLKSLTNLKELWLNSTQVTDKGLESLKGLTNLETLYLNGTQITDKGLECLSSLLNLKTLWLDKTQVTDKGLESLTVLTNLEALSLDDTQVTDKGMKCLGGLMNLETLWLSRTQFTDKGLESLKGLTNLEMLFLYGTQVTDKGLESLSSLTGLTSLYLSSPHVTKKAVEIFKSASPSCSIHIGHRT